MSTKLLDPFDQRLAERLMGERQARGWSLADLAGKSGVSRAMISRIERGESSPTAALLGRLSGAFGLSLSRLLARAEAGAGSEVTRAGEQPAWRDPATGFRRSSLTPAIEGAPPLELIGAELPPGAEIAYPASAYAFIEDQQILVLSGRLRFRQAAKAYDLGPGDCLRLGPASDCVFANRGKVLCRYIVAVLSRRERT